MCRNISMQNKAKSRYTRIAFKKGCPHVFIGLKHYLNMVYQCWKVERKWNKRRATDVPRLLCKPVDLKVFAGQNTELTIICHYWPLFAIKWHYLGYFAVIWSRFCLSRCRFWSGWIQIYLTYYDVRLLGLVWPKMSLFGLFCCNPDLWSRCRFWSGWTRYT